MGEKWIPDSMQRELTRSRSYYVFEVSWNTTGKIDHQEKHKCKNFSDENLIDTDLLLSVVTLTIYSTTAHIVFFSQIYV